MSSETSPSPATAETTANSSGNAAKRSRVARGGKNTSSARKGYQKNRGQDNTPSNKQEEEELDESEQCIICADRIYYAALTPCNHTTCHRCTFRQRALYLKTQCLICRSENEKVIFTEQITASYDEFAAASFVKYDATHHIEFTQEYIYDDTLDLLNYKCTVCYEKFESFKVLSEHVKNSHGKFYCLICSKNKKAFVSELDLYTFKALQKHQSEGDGDDSGFGGHPECKHCHGKRFYSIDELNIHIRDKHERCHICDQYNPKTADYFKNYDTLYNHFRRDHYVCTMPTCVEKKFVVFREDLDLTAHMLREHGGMGSGSSKIVIGSNSRHFQSQLSTFQSNSRRYLERNDEEEDHNSTDTKRRRFEERAKHYVNYDQTKFAKFISINNTFKSKRISAKELYDAYTGLFEKQSSQELKLLVNEFIEFFPASSEFHKDLLPIVKELQFAEDNEQFPVLGNSSGSSTPTWVKSQGSSKPNEKFPALGKPNKKPVPIVSSQPIRYTTITKKTPIKKVVVHTSSGQSGYVPNYLNNSPKLGSSRSASPEVGSSSSRTGNWSRSGTGSSVSLNGTASPKLDSKFPVLEKKSTKKIIPRVKPIEVVDPNQWGRVEEPQPAAVEDSIPIIDKRQQKLKKKQERLLFSNGF